MTFAAAKSLRAARRDQEFLPAALEILETPPSPLQTALALAICGFVVVALTWAYFSPIDIIATAQGKIQPTGRVKFVQPTETGKIALLRVTNGSRVNAGDILAELDPSDADAEEAAASAELNAARAEVARRKAAVLLAHGTETQSVPDTVWTGAIPGAFRRREAEVLVGELKQLAASVSSLKEQILQKQAEMSKLDAAAKSQAELVGTLGERVQMRQTLIERGAGSRADLLDALETWQTERTNLANQLGQRKEVQQNVEVLKAEVAKTYAAFIAENEQRLVDAARRVDDAEQKLIKASARRAKLTIRSPIAGTVQSLSITTVGQVVTVGEQLMRIVPEGSRLEIECYLPNKDVGFVKADQEAVLKLEAFPFTRYGTLPAKVLRIAHDAIPEPDATAIEGDPTKSTRSETNGSERTQNLVFPVNLSPSVDHLNVDGTDIALSPGMAVTVEIKTGQRHILEYLFSPVVEVASRALKER